MDRCRLGPADDIQRNRLVRVAAEAANFEVAIPGVDRVTQRRGGLRRSLETEHALVSGLGRRADQPACAPRLPAPLMLGSSCRRSTLVIWYPWPNNAPGRPLSATRYALWIRVGIGRKTTSEVVTNAGVATVVHYDLRMPDAATCGAASHPNGRVFPR